MVDVRGIPRDNACLRAPHQFISTEAHQVDALMNGFSRRDFTIDVKMLLGINQCAASQIEDQRAVMFPGQVCQCFKGERGHEACHGKVALMHLENHHRVVADSPPIIFQCGVIGGPYFAQSDACRFQDFRYSEASTNLDEFTSGKNHFGLRTLRAAMRISIRAAAQLLTTVLEGD